MTKHTENKPATVPLAQQAGEKPAPWRWVEPSVWTIRMLTALEQGVEGGKWFRLFDKVFSERNLLASLQQVASKDGAAGVDHVTTREFVRQLPDSLWELSDQIRGGTYRPQAVRRVQIPKPGTAETRPLGIPTVRDRIVQAAIVHVIEPIFERDFAEHSYGFRPGRGCKDALRRVDWLLKDGYVHVVDADLKGYFDSIPHDRLMTRLETKIADGQVLKLIESFLTAGIQDGEAESTPEAGAPQGAVLSPLLSNVYLDPLDHLIEVAGFEMVRYADDFVILCRTSDDAQRVLGMVRQWTEENGLTLHPTKTKIVDARKDGFDFLGYTFCDGRHVPRKKSIGKMKDTIRERTRRTSGKSLHGIIIDVNRALRGWFVYFQHAPHRVFPPLDMWIRQRLRAILKKRNKRRGCAKGWDFRQWPNAFFADSGLFSMVTAHNLACQSLTR